MGNASKKLITQIVFPVVVMVLIMMIGTMIIVPSLVRDNIESSVHEASLITLDQFKALRGYYTKFVIKKVTSGSNLEPSFDHESNPGKIPLPATMIHDLSEMMEKEDGVTLTLYSAFPFPNRQHRQLDRFQSTAWDTFINRPEDVLSETVRIGERTTMRVAIADVMQVQACVDCHNTHPLSPKTDWALGDVRGVLELNTDITNQMALADRLSKAIVLGIVGAGTVLIGVFILLTRRITRQIGGMTSAMSRLTQGDYAVEVGQDMHVVEIAQMADAVDSFKTTLIERRKIEEDLRENHESLTQQGNQIEFTQSLAIIANDAEDLRQGVEATLNRVCDYTGWDLGHAFLPEGEDLSTLLPTGIWAIKESDREQFEPFMERTRHGPLRIGEGLFDEVLEHGDPVLIADVSRNEQYSRREMALACGLRGGFGLAIMAGSQVVGVLEFYSTSAGLPSENVQKSLKDIGIQLGRVAERARLLERFEHAAHEAQEASQELSSQRQEMLINERRMQQAAELTHIGYWVWDEIEDKVISCSEECANIHGVSVDEFISISNSSDQDITWFHPDDREYFLETNHKFQVDHMPYTMEYRIVTRQGETRWVRDIAEPVFDENGVHIRTNGVIQDVTERKHNEIGLAEARIKAETANLAKSNFLSTMSHEIRTPLNGVLGLTQLLRDTELDEDQRNKVNTILSSGQTLLSIINDVLDMSKIEAGNLELEERAFSLTDLISTIASPFQSLADDRGLKLLVSSDIPSDCVVKGDPVRLRQILWNLLSNAIKFTEKGQIDLSMQIDGQLRDGQLLADAKDQIVHFAVEDTGIGIPQDRVEVIFDAFTQEDSSISRKYGGTGLGLTIVKQLTELMGGSITATSELNKGTTFLVHLPFSNATKEEREAISLRATDAAVHKTEPMNVLVAEDNEVNAAIARAFLEKFGHRVKHVENGKLAVEVAKEGWADLILMDIHMPEMNGIDATKKIRSTEIGKNIPIVGLTAEAFAERHAQFMEAGMVDVLTKPFTEQQLADTLASNRPIDRRKTNRSVEQLP